MGKGIVRCLPPSQHGQRPYRRPPCRARTGPGRASPGGADGRFGV